MAVMKVERTNNYTVMANHHLRDKQLSLKAKGLLSVMLSLPAEWDYTLAGLAYISKEGVDAIRAAIRELESAGYVIRTRVRNEAGQLGDTEYTIYELPQRLDSNRSSTGEGKKKISRSMSGSKQPVLEKPMLENPILDMPIQGKPTLENPAQINIEGKRKEIVVDTSNPYPSSIYPSIAQMEKETKKVLGVQPASHTLSIPQRLQGDLLLNDPIIPQPALINRAPDVPMLRRKPSFGELLCGIKDQIEYPLLIEENDKSEIDNILAIIVEIQSAQCEHFTISGRQYPAGLVHQRFKQIKFRTIEYVLDCIHKCGSDIRNLKQYLIAALFNAPATMESYYSAAVRRDFEFLRN